MSSPSQQRPCKNLVLDAGPLLSLSPLRGLAETYFTVPQVLDELKDKRAREHFERLGLTSGVHIKVQEPDAGSLAHVIQFAKKTGDYSVLSHADLCVLALTYALDLKAKTERLRLVAEPKEKTSTADPVAPDPVDSTEQPTADVITAVPTPDGEQTDSSLIAESPKLSSAEAGHISDESGSSIEAEFTDEESDHGNREPLGVELERVVDVDEEESNSNSTDDLRSAQPADPPSLSSTPAEHNESAPIFDDPSESDDGEGEWITPSNVEYHKSCALDLLPSSGTDGFTAVSNNKSRRRGGAKGKGGAAFGPGDGLREQVDAGCMTADFAMQNVLLQMGLNLVGVDGKRIERVKTWVLRCHACFKICKDSSKKFCPACGNATLLRTSVTTSSPSANNSTPTMQVHLKKNYTYRTRGTIYSIPFPKPGSSKKGTGEGLILREDQTEYLRARKHEEGKKEREERRLVQGALTASKDGSSSLRAGSWMDPDWVPEILSVGTGGKGRSMRDSRVATGADGMPVIGYGKKNPNERRRRK